MRGLVVLSGGTGSAKLVRGMQALGQFSVVANVADNGWFHGTYVCPDLDTIIYTLAGIENKAHGWGIEGDTFRTLEQLKALGSPDTWFQLGDRDLATSIVRTNLLGSGRTLTEATEQIAHFLGVTRWDVLPASDQHYETRVITREEGDLHLQEFWVREHGQPDVQAVSFKGLAKARLTAKARSLIASAERVVIPPANPVTSILPIVSLKGVKALMSRGKTRVVAISPMIGKGPVSGPAAKFMASMGLQTTSVGVSKLYKGLVDVLIVDESDRGMRAEIEKNRMECKTATILMTSPRGERALARAATEA